MKTRRDLEWMYFVNGTQTDDTVKVSLGFWRKLYILSSYGLDKKCSL